ncbi:MAG: hypothetical protein QNJ46_15890 [Leptolyngbyaceae cyanobacterium MO_188.B28]|nr:hypothetical protein [Leptolyngbyaceae cyanobacterium MO_188.B28]
MNTVMTVEEIEAFVHSDYADRDIMHNLAHIHRLQKLAQEIAISYEHDPDLLELGAYFHGNIAFKEAEIRQFLKDKQLQQKEIDKVVQVAWESQKESHAETMEGKILHDAHLLEGGKTFMIAKSLVTGTARGQSLEETLQYLEEKILGKFECCFPESQKLYAEKEEYTKLFLKDLRSNL